MSMIVCDNCDRVFCYDDDPDCFDEETNLVTCDHCREEEEEE